MNEQKGKEVASHVASRMPHTCPRPTVLTPVLGQEELPPLLAQLGGQGQAWQRKDGGEGCYICLGTVGCQGLGFLVCHLPAAA